MKASGTRHIFAAKSMQINVVFYMYVVYITATQVSDFAGSGPKWTQNSEFGDVVEKRPDGEFVFKCPASGSPPPDITWLKDEQPLEERYIGQAKLRNKNFTMRLDYLTVQDSGNYTCVVWNEHAEIRRTVQLVVTGVTLYPPVFLDPPRNHTAVEGDTVTFACRVRLLGGTQYLVVWFRHYTVNGSHTGPDGYAYATRINRTLDYDGANHEVLVLRTVSRNDSGWYTCVASNSMGHTQQQMWLTVTQPERLPQPETAKDKSLMAPAWRKSWTAILDFLRYWPKRHV